MSNTRILKTLGLVLGIALAFQACKKDVPALERTAVTVAVTNPEGIDNVSIDAATLTLTEINSGATYSATVFENGQFTIDAPAGSYAVTVIGSVSYSRDGFDYDGEVRGVQNGVVISGTEKALTLELFLYNNKTGFVLSEIYFTGSQTPEGKTYNGDKYFVVYNNSDVVLYADGLVFAESDFLTTTKREYTPDVMASAFTSATIVMIPGDGDDYPVQPGASVVVANNAIDHREFNANSIDLSGADFEVELLSALNVDNPQVTDLVNVAPYLTMHNRGFKSYVLAKFEGDVEAFQAQQAYEYEYDRGGGSMRTVASYKIPNEWIVDAVNLSVESEFEWIVTDPSLDMGWTYCGKVNSDDNRYGKSVRRKVASTTADGRQVLQDTNNSTEDFEPEAALSLAN
ncbi:DUF4876 domain-containing protein [Parapedobacter sp. 10938]|uniref:DUF4876 domain-containing protein n=1 Tax=Parapedobacter flavus TaxID=3110225 RepID=UPI002DBC0247|nr:DUF4876 domain-containing protein [Parapedobacter sp. 10938]MEC3879695.1 DUF4876 domain-containing protein [Parapedobacter sp. 10938]